MTKLPVPSVQQRKAIKLALLGDLMVKSSAGSGKTTLLIQMADAMSKRFPKETKLMVVFNVSAAQEIERRLAKYNIAGWRVRTFNSMGMATLMANQFAGAKPEVDAYKNKKLAASFIKRHPSKIADSAYHAMSRLDVKSFLTKVGSSVVDNEMYRTVLAEGLSICKRFGIKYTDKDLVSKFDTCMGVAESPFAGSLLAKLAPVHLVELLKTNKKVAEAGIIDYEDQVYYAALYCKHIGSKYDIILCDEFQDASFLNHTQVIKAVKKKLILVGDPNQAIYSWRGAVPNSMDVMAQRRPVQQTMLSVSYRCPQIVCKRQQDKGMMIEPHPSAPRGIVCENFYSRNINTKAGTKRKLWYFGDFKQPVTFLSRRNDALLLSLIMALKENLTNYTFQFSGPYLSATKLLLKTPEQPVHIMLQKMLSDRNMSFEDALNNGKPHLRFMTIHAAKGLEWDNIAYLNPSQDDGRCEQYVAETRTIKALAHVYLQNHCNKSLYDKAGFELLPEVKFGQIKSWLSA